MAIFGNSLQRGGACVPESVLSGKKVALHFSASWCPDCQTFTPYLKKWYEEHRNEVEIIQVSSENSEEDMTGNMGAWLNVKFNDPLQEELKQKYHCFAGKEQCKFPDCKREYGIPGLVVIDPKTGDVKIGDATEQVQKDVADLSKW